MITSKSIFKADPKKLSLNHRSWWIMITRQILEISKNNLSELPGSPYFCRYRWYWPNGGDTPYAHGGRRSSLSFHLIRKSSQILRLWVPLRVLTSHFLEITFHWREIGHQSEEKSDTKKELFSASRNGSNSVSFCAKSSFLDRKHVQNGPLTPPQSRNLEIKFNHFWWNVMEISRLVYW